MTADLKTRLQAGEVCLRRGFGAGRLLHALPVLLLLLSGTVEALTISDAWASPRSRERARRGSTRYIILHTTEGGSAGALRKLQRNGEAHYLVDEAGAVFRIVDRRRVAYHCGLSMWDGRTNLDEVSLGIEVAGYHHRDLSAAQVRSLAALLRELQRIYRISDERVLTHSMVAYGEPNRWHRQRHRGRKRCGMQFAGRDLRRQLGLHAQPRFDPDVRAGRLVNADPELAAALYGAARAPSRPVRISAGEEAFTITPRRTAWDIARDRYDSPDTLYIYPDGTQRRGSEITRWGGLPEGTQVLMAETAFAAGPLLVLGRHGDSPHALAGAAWRQACTLYLFEDGRLIQGDALSEEDAARLPTGTRMLLGYRVGGPVGPGRRAFDISGARWNAPDTFYLFPDGQLIPGNGVDERRIPAGTRVLYRAPRA